GRDRGLVAGREIPYGELDPASLERARNARNCHSVAAWGGRAERGEDRHAGGHRPEHTGADAARKERTGPALNLSHAPERQLIMYGDVGTSDPWPHDDRVSADCRPAE